MRTPLLAATILVVAILPGSREHTSDSTGLRPDSTIVDFTTHEGTRLAFDVSLRDGSIAIDLLGQLWIVPAAGGVARPITDAVRDTAEDLDPSFSPDGRRLLFQSDRPGGRALWMTDAEGGPPARVTASRIPYYARAEPAWAPDGRRFVYVRSGALVMHDLEGEADRPLSIGNVSRLAPSSPSWSGDGQWIAFVNGGRRSLVWRVRSDGGSAEPIGDSTIVPTIATLSPAGDMLAVVAPDSLGRAQLWVQTIGGRARRLTSHEDLVRHRVRWAPDGHSLVYSADGRLWRISVDGGSPTEIPFAARVRFVRHTAAIRRVTFPVPGSVQPARGFDGLALSPDGSRIAMIALDSLWVWKPGDRPHAVVHAGQRAHDLAWSPDSRSVVWSAGLPGEENLYVTDVASRGTRPLTAMIGSEWKPALSPDGGHVAFLHRGSAFGAGRLRVVSVTGGGAVTDADSTDAESRTFGEIPGLWMGEQGFAWTPNAKAILTYANAVLQDEPYPARLRMLPLDGPARDLASPIHAPTFITWFDSTVTYVQADRLWRGRMRDDGTPIGAPTPLGDDPALTASAARDGSVLYVSDDGLRLRRPDGRVTRLGWPLELRTADSPAPLLVRNVHIVDGTSTASSLLRDVLLANGRVQRIAPAGGIGSPNVAAEIDAGGRFAMAGLIDMHAHFFPESPAAGFLYHGVTTARDVGSQAASTAALRDAIDAGITSGPRIVLGGFFFHTQGGVDDGATGLADQMVGDSAGLERAMRLADALGAGYIKHRGFDDWRAAVRTIAAAHRHGLPLSGHCVHILPIIAAGMDGKEHSGDCFRDFGRIYEDFTRLYAAAGIWLDPTVGLYAPVARAAADSTILDQPSIAPWLLESLRRRYLVGQPAAQLERSLALARSRTAALHAAGVPLIAGTDQGLADGIHWELEQLVRSGLSPAEAITAATSRTAEALGASRELGTIAEGKRADLIILDADPLLDITNARRIWRVIQGGRIVDREALLRNAPNAAVRSLSEAASPSKGPRPQ